MSITDDDVARMMEAVQVELVRNQCPYSVTLIRDDLLAALQ